jgi:hypothetical protein
MFRTVFLLAITFFICAATIAKSQAITFDEPGDYIQKWFDLRVKNAKKGKREVVEILFVVRSNGWGCDCPLYYMGTETLVTSGFWLDPILPSAGDFPQSDSVGHVLLAKGYFTGKINKESYGNPEDSIFYVCPNFKIISWKYKK